ncbi:MAG: helix-turn-helix domain-containing protein [Clostridiales bacterium]|jgi:sugar diacid utilization regulator|nr:helix-turn-helix domain-containing protein [Eubacteriales bacterium]MDH7566383.1 helix-turn-helix domain-containing protein [Clostridiales bacterium]
MGLNLEILMSELSQHHPELYLSSQTPVSIHGVKFLACGQTTFVPGYLYIGMASQLSNLAPFQFHANILCISDCDIPEDCKQDPKLNLVVLEGKADLREIFNKIMDLLWADQKLAQGSKKLLDALFHGEGISRIIDIGCELLGNPIFLGDSSSKIIVYPKHASIEGTLLDEHLKKGYLSYDTLHSPEYKNMSEKVSRSKSPVLFKGVGKYDHITAKVTIDNTVVGYLLVFGVQKKLDHQDIDLMALLSDVIASEMQKDKFYKNTKGAIHENIIRDLLEERLRDKKVIEERVRSMDLNPDEPHCIIAVDVRQFYASRFFLSFLRSSLENIIPSSKSVIFEDYIVMVAGCSKESSLSEKELTALEKFLANSRLYAGISRSFKSFEKLRYHFNQSLISIELGIRVNENKTVFFYEDYAISHLIDIGSSCENLKELCHPSLFKLADYDAKNKTLYMQTLYIYLLNQGNHFDTSKMLHIHVSSLYYRIARIEEIMGVKLNDIHRMHYLFLSLKILSHMNVLEPLDVPDIAVL